MTHETNKSRSGNQFLIDFFLKLVVNGALGFPL